MNDERQGRKPRRLRWEKTALLVMLVAWASVAVAGNAPSYRYEDDPVRLGNKALIENRLDEAAKRFNEAIANNYQVYKARCGLAYILMRQGESTKAEPLFRQALEETKKETGSDNFPELHAGLGLVLVRLGKPDEARQFLNRALAIREGYWPAEYGLARLAILDKKYDEARSLVSHGKDKSGLEKGEDYYLYGLALLQRVDGQLEEAEKNALKASVIDPAQPEYLTLVAEIYEDRGSPQLAIVAYERALTAPGMIPTAPLYRNLGVQYEKEKRYNEALDRYKKAVAMDSTYTPAWHDMASLYALAKRYNEAAVAWQRYTNLEAGDIEGYVGLAKACLKTNRIQPAKQAAQKAWSMDSTRVDVRLLTARSSFLGGDKERAERLYWTVSDSTLFEAPDFVCLGQLEMKEKDYETADKHLRRAVDLDSTLADAFFSLGVLKLTEKKPDSAEVSLRKAIAISPRSSGAHLNLGVALMQLKRGGEAVTELREATRLSPNSTQGFLYLGHALMGVDSLSAAKVAYERASELAPQDAAPLRGRGYILLQKGAFDEAIPILRQATELDPNSFEGWTMLGQAYLGRGDFAQATPCFKRALELRPNHEPAKKGLESAEKGFREGMEVGKGGR